MKNKNYVIVSVIVVLLVGIIVFFGGMKYQDGVNNSPGGQNRQGRFGGGRPVTGEITDAKEIIVEGSNYKFSPNKITVKKGEKTRIVLKNLEGTHDFKVDELNIAIRVIQTGEEDFVEFTADKIGQYEFYCSVDGHRQMGMKGTLVVE